MLASQPIYNYDDGSDRRQSWYGGSGIRANMVFVDGHAKIGVDVAQGLVYTTDAYTFLPSPTWLEQFGVFDDDTRN